MRTRILAASVALALGSIAAQAQQGEVCLDQRTGQVDRGATQVWQQMRARENPQAMQAQSGVWYGEIRNPATGQVDHRYQTFAANGGFEYQSRVCGATGICSDFYGNGVFTAHFTGQGVVSLMIILSDLSRRNLCVTGQGRFVDQSTMVDSYGVTWRRYR